MSLIFAQDLAALNMHRIAGHPVELLAQRQEKFARRFETELAQPQETLIVSAEGASCFTPEQIADLRDRTEAGGRKLEIFAYVREPIGLAGSSLQQGLKQHGRKMRRFNAVGQKERLKHWFDVLGPEPITVRRFDPARFDGGSAVRDFAAFCGIDPDRLSETQSNESASDGAVRLLWAFASSMPLHSGRPKLFRAFMRFSATLIEEIRGPKFRTPVQCLTDPDKLAAEVDWLAEHTGVDFRPEFEAARGHMVGAPLDNEMSQIDDDTLAQLDALLDRLGIGFVRGQSTEAKLAALYFHFLAPEPGTAV